MNRAATYPSPLFDGKAGRAKPAPRKAPGTALAHDAFGWLPAQVRSNLTPRARRLMRSGD